MYWASEACTTHGDDLNADDIEGITALYGPSASFVCSHELSDELATGNVPFELKCSVVSDYLDEITSVEWRWGDGAVSEGNSASHVYESAGNYTVEVVVEGDRESCGDDGWTNTFRKVGFVRACAEPVPEFRIEHVDGLKYSMLNETDVSVYGCYSNIEWQVFSGSDVSGEPIQTLTYNGWDPNITFPDDGMYTVVLNIGGPAGTGAASLTFEADNHRGQGYAGCHTATGTGGAALAMLAGLAGLARRRARG
ncbi:MAG: PKD domain-containing protein [Deltaproteobacteria bacterium]|nr:PKD domain-containing protein [Deltaproteobacteria bacterium]